MSALTEPLRFERIFIEKVWGGRALEGTLGLTLPPDVPIGETWEIVDRSAENSVVDAGEHAGRSLGELMGASSSDLLGRAKSTPDGRFPLLVKYIDACQDLSVQVHPTDDSAVRLGGGAEGKTEAWYILEARPGAVLYCGLKPGVDRRTFEREAAGPGVVDLLERWEVAAGDCLLVPGGTVHAIGAGVTLIEVQQNSNTTYRVYDWGRVGLDGEPRETHVEQALAVVDFDLPRRAPIQASWADAGGLLRAPLVRTRHFGINALQLSQSTRLGTGRQFQIYAALGGRGTIRMRGSGCAYAVSPGDVWLVPAAAGYHYFEPESGAGGQRDALTVLQFLALP